MFYLLVLCYTQCLYVYNDIHSSFFFEQAPAGSPGQHSQYVVQQQKPPHNNNIMNSYASENQLSSVSYNNNNVVGNSQTYNPKLPLRPAIADELNYRESPPPPPPPPTSTHPLYQPSGSGANNQRSPDNRYIIHSCVMLNSFS